MVITCRMRKEGDSFLFSVKATNASFDGWGIIELLHGMGPKALEIIRQALAAKGLSFAEQSGEENRS